MLPRFKLKPKSRLGRLPAILGNNSLYDCSYFRVEACPDLFLSLLLLAFFSRQSSVVSNSFDSLAYFLDTSSRVWVFSSVFSFEFIIVTYVNSVSSTAIPTTLLMSVLTAPGCPTPEAPRPLGFLESLLSDGVSGDRQADISRLWIVLGYIDPRLVFPMVKRGACRSIMLPVRPIDISTSFLSMTWFSSLILLLISVNRNLIFN